MSNWDCPWTLGIELITKRRLLLCPMEKIKQKFNNDEFAEIVIDDKDDIDYMV